MQRFQHGFHPVEDADLRDALLRQSLPAVHSAFRRLAGKAEVCERLPARLAEGRAKLFEGMLLPKLAQHLLKTLLIDLRRIEKRSVYIKNKIFHAFSSIRSRAMVKRPRS